jgi:hypothetical protein
MRDGSIGHNVYLNDTLGSNDSEDGGEASFKGTSTKNFPEPKKAALDS